MNRYNMGKCKNRLGFSDTADMLKQYSPSFRRQMEYYNLDMNTIESKEEGFLQNCLLVVCC